jgi:hypothetical protein
MRRPSRVDTPGQVGSVARDESSPAATEGPSAPQNRAAPDMAATARGNHHGFRIVNAVLASTEPGWGPWSIKSGIAYAHAPARALSRVVALRVTSTIRERTTGHCVYFLERMRSVCCRRRHRSASPMACSNLRGHGATDVDRQGDNLEVLTRPPLLARLSEATREVEPERTRVLRGLAGVRSRCRQGAQRAPGGVRTLLKRHRPGGSSGPP